MRRRSVRRITHTLIADLPELGPLSRRQISTLVGVVPFRADSGQRQWQKSDRRQPCRRSSRTAAVAMLVTIRRKLPLATTYQRLRAAGKPAKVAMVATMRKLLVVLNAIMRDDAAWRGA